METQQLNNFVEYIMSKKSYELPHAFRDFLLRFCTTAMLHGRNNRFFFLWEQMFFLMQNIFIVPAMQHGCHAKPQYISLVCGN